jgi:hypothetical protein
MEKSLFSMKNFKNLLKEQILKAEMNIWSTEYFLQVANMIKFSAN